MSRPSPLLWFVLVGIILLPTAAGRLLLDLAGGFIVVLLALPLLLTGIGWIGWRFLQSRLITCEVCGASIVSSSMQCPVCGSDLSNQLKSKGSASEQQNSIPASSATIDITAKDAD